MAHLYCSSTIWGGESSRQLFALSLPYRSGKTSPQSRLVVCATAARGLRVVVTGSTKGLGRALAEQFVLSGDSVVITSRSDDRVQQTVKHLGQLSKPGVSVKGLACNVSKPGDVKALTSYAAQQFGGIDVWINNAGTNSYRFAPLPDFDDLDLVNVVETNMLGVMLCCREAIRTMSSSTSVGHIFNMDGAGADGSATPRFAAYGATKHGLNQLSKSLQAELRSSGTKSVCIHNLSPGMVTTDLLMSGGDSNTAKFFINCLAEPPNTVAKYLVPKIRKVATEMRVPGTAKSTYIKFLTKGKAYGRILARLLLGKRKGRFFEE